MIKGYEWKVYTLQETALAIYVTMKLHEVWHANMQQAGVAMCITDQVSPIAGFSVQLGLLRSAVSSEMPSAPASPAVLKKTEISTTGRDLKR